MPQIVPVVKTPKNEYTYQFDNKGGVNYFRDNIPVTNQEYARNTGNDTRSIEQYAAEKFAWDKYGQGSKVPSKDAVAGVNIDTLANTPAVDNQSVTADDINKLIKSIAGTGGTSSSTAPEAPIDYGTKIYNNRTYNFNSPEERLAYYNDVAANLGAQRDQAIAEAQNAFRTNNEQSVRQYQGYISQLDQSLADIGAEAKNFATDYFKTVNNFNEGKGTGDVNRQNYFASISPNAFQSSQATSQDFANDKYTQGLGDLATQANNVTGIDYINNFDPNGANNTAFGAGSQYGRQVADVGTQRANLENNFNVYNTSAQQGLQTNLNNIGQQYQTGLSSQAESLGAVDLAQKTNPFQYGMQATTPYKAPVQDMASFTPYTNFSSLSNTSIPGNTYTKPINTSNAFSGDQVSNYLNRTKSTVPKGKNDWFNNYLQGKVTA